MVAFKRTPLRRCSRLHLMLPENCFPYADGRNTSVLGVAFDNVSQRARNGRYHETYCRHHDDVYTRHIILIEMEERWVDDPTCFGLDIFAHIGLPPTADHSLDRVNGLLGYHLANLRWADWWVQARNRANPGQLVGKEVAFA